MGLRVAELETLFTADITDLEAKAKTVEKRTTDLAKKDPKVKIAVDEKPAITGLERVEQAAQRVAKTDATAKVDADITRAKDLIDDIEGDLYVLDGMRGTMDVDADIAEAESQLRQAKGLLADLEGEKATMEVDADTSGAESALGGVEDIAGDAGADAGAAFGDQIVTALGTIPIAGAVVGVAAAAAKALVDAFQDGLQVEVRQDRLEALTGISEEQAAQLGRTAAEAYSNNFGESIAGNMDTARVALQQGLLDPEATRQDAQSVIQSLAGIADVMGEDVEPIARAATQMMRTGLVSSAQEAFDVIAAGTREGVNAGDDLLDTFIEYGTHFRDLGISAPEALGLLNQGLEDGAFNADKVADALKEMTIRVKEGDGATRDSLEYIGLNSNAMQDAIAAGGPAARQALADILDGIRAIEDPSERAAVAVDIFGTQAEDMAGALGGLDLSTAVDSLNGVEGAAQRMFDTIAGNDASSIETARRNIEVAADGIKGALAAAFSEPIGNFADYVSENRGPIMEFLLTLANGALDMGEGLVNAFAGGIEGVGAFVGAIGDGMAMAINAIAPVYEAFDAITPGSQGYSEWVDWSENAVNGFQDFEDGATQAADTVRDTLLPGIDDARERLNSFGEPIVNEAYLHDTMLRTAGAVGEVGVAADGTKLSLEGLDQANIVASASGSTLEAQLVTAAAALDAELTAASKAGEGHTELTARVNTTREALIEQTTQMGVGREAATQLVDAILKTPATASTAYSSNSEEEKGRVNQLTARIEQLPDGTFAIVATGLAGALSNVEALNRTLNTIDGKTSTAYVTIKQQGQAHVHDGAFMEFYAQGGMRAPDGRGLVPMSAVAQMVPANTWRVVGDRGDVPEAYIPLDGSQRSLNILMETLRRWPGGPPQLMASGGVTAGTGGGLAGGVHVTIQVSDSAHALSTAYAIKRELEHVTTQVGGLR